LKTPTGKAGKKVESTNKSSQSSRKNTSTPLTKTKAISASAKKRKISDLEALVCKFDITHNPMNNLTVILNI
jgi:hypothetical protein